jgi:hypothetical protein
MSPQMLQSPSRLRHLREAIMDISYRILSGRARSGFAAA